MKNKLVKLVHIFTALSITSFLIFSPVNTWATATLPDSDMSGNSSNGSTISTDQTESKDTLADNSADSGSDILTENNGKCSFSTVMMQGTNRFEIFYEASSKDTYPSIDFQTADGGSYTAKYGEKVDDSYPVKILKGQDLTITPEGNQRSITLEMLVVYFDTTKAVSSEGQVSAGQTADLSINLNGSNIFVITRSEPTVRSQATDGDEIKQAVYTSGDGVLLKYYTNEEESLTTDDVLKIIQPDDSSQVIPATTKPKKKDPTKARIMLGAFISFVAILIALFLSFKNKKKKKKIHEEKMAKKKAIRKRKEKKVRENDRLSGALEAYADEYSDDEFYNKTADEEVGAADRAAEDGLQQIPQDKFAAYAPGIKEALYTVGPEDEEIRKQREAIIKERKASIAWAQDRASENRMIIETADKKQEADKTRSEETLSEKTEAPVGNNATVKNTSVKRASCKTAKAKGKETSSKPTQSPSVKKTKSRKRLKAAPGTVKIDLDKLYAMSGNKKPANSSRIKAKTVSEQSKKTRTAHPKQPQKTDQPKKVTVKKKPAVATKKVNVKAKNSIVL